MLRSLNAHPNSVREIRALIVGRALGLLCHVMGWLAPMYGAGRLESRNIVEYEMAARYAHDCGREEFIDCLLTMAEVEWEHENYFRSLVSLHWLGRRLTLWPTPPPRETIRQSFAQRVEDTKLPGIACRRQVPRLAAAHCGKAAAFRTEPTSFPEAAPQEENLIPPRKG
jgi:hypothetical protein